MFWWFCSAPQRGAAAFDIAHAGLDEKERAVSSIFIAHLVRHVVYDDAILRDRGDAPSSSGRRDAQKGVMRVRAEGRRAHGRIHANVRTVSTACDGSRCARGPNGARGDVCRVSTANAALERLREECDWMDKQYRGNLRWFDSTRNTTTSSVPQVLYRYDLKATIVF